MFGKNKLKTLLLAPLLAPLLLFPLSCPAENAENKTVIINEIAWMGTEQSHYDEWIELKNITERTIDITGWRLQAEDGSPVIGLAGEIAPQGFFILERTDDNTLPQIKADMIYTGALSNKGERIKLTDNKKVTVDIVEAGEKWPAGDNQNKRTMERKQTDISGQPAQWQSSRNPGGTPKAENSGGFKLEKVEAGGRPRILGPEAYYRPANKRFSRTLLAGTSLALLCSGLAVIIRRRLFS